MRVVDSLFAFIADYMDKHRVKTATLTVTTGSTGAAPLSSVVTSSATVLAVDCSSNTYIAIPWIYRSSGGSKQWYAKVLTWQNWSVVGNTSVTLTVRYIDGMEI